MEIVLSVIVLQLYSFLSIKIFIDACNCGGDTEQKVNGVISYIPISTVMTEAANLLRKIKSSEKSDGS